MGLTTKGSGGTELNNEKKNSVRERSEGHLSRGKLKQRDLTRALETN